MASASIAERVLTARNTVETTFQPKPFWIVHIRRTCPSSESAEIATVEGQRDKCGGIRSGGTIEMRFLIACGGFSWGKTVHGHRVRYTTYWDSNKAADLRNDHPPRPNDESVRTRVNRQYGTGIFGPWTTLVSRMNSYNIYGRRSTMELLTSRRAAVTFTSPFRKINGSVPARKSDGSWTPGRR